MQFTEKQTFRQTWFFPVLLISFVSTAIGPLIEFAAYHKTGIFHWPVLLVFIVPVMVGILFWYMGLITEIDETGVHYRFMVMQGKTKEIPWSDIASAYVRKYSPLKEFGGWGLRYSFRNGRAINVSGNIGLQLITKKGKKILIGTVKKDELSAFMDDLYKKGIVSKGADEANIKDRY